MDKAITARIEQHFQRHALLTGRGTSALYLILRAIKDRYGSGNVLIPDMLCQTVLDAVLLAGFTPRLVDITPSRFTIDPDSAAERITSDTRAILMVHTFGHIADIVRLRRLASQYGCVLIEDAVQGIGGTYGSLPIGVFGDLSFISFQPGKTLQGGAGAILWEDPIWTHYLNEALTDLSRSKLYPMHVEQLSELTSRDKAESYLQSIRHAPPRLLKLYNPQTADTVLMRWSLDTLAERVAVHNTNALTVDEWLKNNMALRNFGSLPLILPDIRPGDAMWRYAFAIGETDNIGVRVYNSLRRLFELNKIEGARDYYPFSAFFDTPNPPSHSHSIRDGMINIFVEKRIDLQV